MVFKFLLKKKEKGKPQAAEDPDASYSNID